MRCHGKRSYGLTRTFTAEATTSKTSSAANQIDRKRIGRAIKIASPSELPVQKFTKLAKRQNARRRHRGHADGPWRRFLPEQWAQHPIRLLWRFDAKRRFILGQNFQRIRQAQGDQ